MLNLLAGYLSQYDAWSAFRLFDFITVRASLALLFAFGFCVVFGKQMISRLRRLQAVQYVRDSTGEGAVSLNEIHGGKNGTPTMGGLLMLAALLFSVLLFMDLTEPVLWLALLATVGFCAIGFLDDYLKAVKKNSEGLTSQRKLILQISLAVVFASIYLYFYPHIVSYDPGNGGKAFEGPDFILPPFFKHMAFSIGGLYLIWVALVLTATSNAVNLTDGQDGLAAGVTICVTGCFAVIAYLAGRVDSSEYLIIPFVQGAGELAVLLAALAGSCMGFLWFNSHPAEVFMGDTGSMMLGGLLGASALLVKQEVLLIIVGGIFVAEAVSVIVQVLSYKWRGRRVFRMAPLHHHFQMGGVPEAKITMRFWIVSALLALFGLFTLKLR